MPYTGSGETIWRLGPEAAEQVQLPVSVGAFYGYSPLTQRVLMAAAYPDHGAGPTPVSVSDLSILDLTTDKVEAIIPDDVVEALFAPNGSDIAYILASPSTYELHWLDPSGKDRLLASDVAFTWSISPTGEAIAFTRESRYGVGGTPGLYVVNVVTGTEVQLSDADKAGYGATTDAPFWLTDGSRLIFPVWGSPEGGPRLILARADGSEEQELSVAPAQRSEWWASLQIPTMLADPDGQHWLAVPEASEPSTGQMGGPLPLVLYRLDEDSGELEDGVLLGTIGSLLGWDVPGHSVWVLSFEGNVERVELP
jgi:hypothetical protein